MPLSATQAIAEFATSTSLDDIGEAVQQAASRVVMDTVGVMLAGLTSEEARLLLELMSARAGRGPANVVGLDLSLPPENAALINATLGHALDFDDVNELYPGHPSAIVLGALLASGEPAELSGRAVLEAYTIGVEAGGRIGAALGRGHYMRGFHSTSTVGIFAAVIALAKLHGFSAQQTARAMGVAGSFTGGIRCNFGTMTKPLHSGRAAQSAVLAVDLVRLGFSANDDVLDAERGFFAVYGDDESSTETIADALGAPFGFQHPGVGLKRYPCCNGLHRSIDAALEIVAEHGPPSESVESVTCRVPTDALNRVLYSRPTTGVEGKFSFEYVIAVALADGAVGIEAFTEDAVNRPETQALLRKVTVREDTDCDAEGGPQPLGAGGAIEVEVHTTSGDSYSARVTHVLGSTQRPLSWDQVQEKFISCARAVGVRSDNADRAAEQLRNLAAARNVRQIVCCSGGLFAETVVSQRYAHHA